MSKRILSANTAIFLGLTSQALAAAPCDRSVVQSRVCQTTLYDPSTANYQPPACNQTSDYDTSIGNMYDIAPGKVQEELCTRLTKIIVQTDGQAYSWGYWENPATKSKLGTQPNSYVGIRVDATTSTLANVLDQNAKAVFTNSNPNLYMAHTVTSDSLALGLLAVVAHEIGHIKWHRDGIYSNLLCYYDKFINASWNANANLATSVSRFWHPTLSNLNGGGPPANRLILTIITQRISRRARFETFIQTVL